MRGLTGRAWRLELAPQLQSPFAADNSHRAVDAEAGQLRHADVVPVVDHDAVGTALDDEAPEAAFVFDCMECGACSFACPSNIPIVQLIRVAKSSIRGKKKKG